MGYELVLCHHGILGQKWGIRRTPEQLGHIVKQRVNKARDDEKRYREKLTAISKNKSANPNDVKRFKYRNQSLGKRVGKTAATVTAQMLIGDMLTGRISNYGSMSKAELTKKLTKIATTTAANVALNDALAKSASKRYTDSGKRAKGVKDHLLTKEDMIETGVSAAVRAAPFLHAALQIKVAQTYATRDRNEQEFNRWGKNILTEKVDNIIWSSDDGKTQVIG